METRTDSDPSIELLHLQHYPYTSSAGEMVCYPAVAINSGTYFSRYRDCRNTHRRLFLIKIVDETDHMINGLSISRALMLYVNIHKHIDPFVPRQVLPYVPWYVLSSFPRLQDMGLIFVIFPIKILSSSKTNLTTGRTDLIRCRKAQTIVHLEALKGDRMVGS
jgi:hypothetical protein